MKSNEHQTLRTYTHGVIGYLLYAKRPRYEQRLAIMGSILPDVFIALGFLPHYSEDESHDFLDGDDEGIGGLAAVEDAFFS